MFMIWDLRHEDLQLFDWVSNTGPMDDKYRLKRKDKNKSREEIFYQMKVFFC